MIGIDIVKIDRFNDVNERFEEKYLSQSEQDELSLREDKTQYLAGRFAGKEAYIKAVGKKLIDYREIEILNDETGRPHLYIRGIETGEISLSHDEFAIAVVKIDKE